MLDTQKPKRTIKRLTPEQIADIKSGVRAGMKPADIAELVGTNIKNVYNLKAKTRPCRKKVDSVAASLNRAAEGAASVGVSPTLSYADLYVSEPSLALEVASLKAENEKLRKLVVDLALQVVGR